MKKKHNIAKNFLSLLNKLRKEFLFVLSFSYFKIVVVKNLKAELLMKDYFKSLQPNLFNSANNLHDFVIRT